MFNNTVTCFESVPGMFAFAATLHILLMRKRPPLPPELMQAMFDKFVRPFSCCGHVLDRLPLSGIDC